MDAIYRPNKVIIVRTLNSFRTYGSNAICRPNTCNRWFGCYMPSELIVQTLCSVRTHTLVVRHRRILYKCCRYYKDLLFPADGIICIIMYIVCHWNIWFDAIQLDPNIELLRSLVYIWFSPIQFFYYLLWLDVMMLLKITICTNDLFYTSYLNY